MKPINVIIGFVPFLVFYVLIMEVGPGWGAAAALFTAVVVIVTTGLDGIKSVPMTLAVILLVTEFAGFRSDPEIDAFLLRYGPSITALLMGLFMIVTAETAPFTAQFARREVPPELWHTRQFLGVNRHASTAWGLSVIVLGLCQVLGAQIDADSAEPLRLAVGWALPLVAFWQAAGYSERAIATRHLDQTRQVGEIDA